MVKSAIDADLDPIPIYLGKFWSAFRIKTFEEYGSEWAECDFCASLHGFPSVTLQ
jgi:hypothetical protein